MDRFEMIAAFVDEVRALPGFRVVRAELERAEAPLDDEVERELREECSRFELDDAMRAWWSEIASVRVEWEGPPLPDGRAPGGVLWVPSAFEVARPAFMEDELDAMACSSSAERELLLELHHVALHDGTHWSALRMREGEPCEVWYRTTDSSGRAPLDIPIGSMTDYTDMLIRSRGADRWQWLLVDPRALAEEDAEHLSRYEAPVLIDALTALARVPSARANAEMLLERAHRLRERRGG